MTRAPSVSVVIPAHKRPVELRRAIAAARAQDYAGSIDVTVVFDRAEPDMSLADEGDRPVRVLANQRAPGLAGARNTGILESTGELVAFCDDDDEWVPEKLTKQVGVLTRSPESPLVTSSIVINYGDHSTVRRAGTTTVTHDMLVVSRMSMLHSSTFVFRRSALLGSVGLIDEKIPGSQSEDWDILFRSSAVRPVLHVDEPLVRVLWGKSSHFSRNWETRIASSLWILDRYPEVAAHQRGSSRLMGQMAFAYASLGWRPEAWRWAARSLRADPLQWRSWLATGVAVVPRSSELVLGTLGRWGRGV
ncbi:glycosyltransferase family 2 protein [Janibacter corallicola]|uniref:glycosyltransferase family 2 protein n=1 Tax=Janibacter corallicola TaxID=415212 RepID=UPI00082C6F0A|nr:glycosyltransferase family 2 protein [Janibacter corallicola]